MFTSNPRILGDPLLFLPFFLGTVDKLRIEQTYWKNQAILNYWQFAPCAINPPVLEGEKIVGTHGH
jgi:hypothetical protein